MSFLLGRDDMDLYERLRHKENIYKYVSEEKKQIYICIIDYLYTKHIHGGAPSLLNDILKHLKEVNPIGLFDDYTEKQLENDLSSLEVWGNVISHPDNSRVSRIEDYKKGRLRYQCHKHTVEFERHYRRTKMITSAMKDGLNPNLVSSLVASIDKLCDFKVKPVLTKSKREELETIWKDIFFRFDRFRDETTDYLGIIHSSNLEQIFQNNEMVNFKDRFKNYLYDFIGELQHLLGTIENSIVLVEESGKLNWAVNEIIAYRNSLPRIEGVISEEVFQEELLNNWNGIKQWFVYNEKGERYVSYIIKETTSMIHKFVKFLQILSEKKQQVKSRQHEFLHFAKLFGEADDIKGCQKVFGAMTNIEKPTHLLVDSQENVSFNELIVHHDFIPKKLDSAKREAIKKKRSYATIEASEEDLKIARDIARKKEKEEEMVHKFTEKGTVVLSELVDIDPFLRTIILDWISRVINKKTWEGKTENGIPYELIKNSDEKIKLHARDGVLIVPDYTFFFKGGR